MIYFDTSFLVPFIVPELTSDAVMAFIGRLPPGELAISHWTEVEFTSLPAHEVRMGTYDSDALHLAIAYNRRARAIYSLDKGLVKAGKMLGSPVSRGISP